ncbi:hypothetical protein [Kordia sp.]|uniref:hypothetical protein n=1 Tax=Kordia sp. TaxID=1965332 RepID=UPI003D288A1D
MNYIKIDRNIQKQTVHLFSARSFDLDAIITFNSISKLLEEIEIDLLGQLENSYKLTSSYLFNQPILGNRSFKIVVVNLQEQSQYQTLQPNIKVNIQNGPFQLNQGDSIYVHINFYELLIDELNFGNFDIYKLNFSPKRKKGNILVGG